MFLHCSSGNRHISGTYPANGCVQIIKGFFHYLLSDFRGKYVLLFFYPLDFTFVCPTEIRGFEKLKSAFEAEGIGVVGASTDSFFSHQAWFADKDIFPDGVTHPVIASLR